MRQLLVYRTVPGRRGWKRLCRFQRYRAECLFILRQILTQQVPQRFGLLRTQIDPLEISQHHFLGGILPGSAKNQQKIPYAGPHLHAVGVAVPIILCLNNIDIRRRVDWLTHTIRVSRVTGRGLHRSTEKSPKPGPLPQAKTCLPATPWIERHSNRHSFFQQLSSLTRVTIHTSHAVTSRIQRSNQQSE